MLIRHAPVPLVTQVWLDRMFEASSPHLSALSAAELCWLLMALATCAARPPPPWMKQFQAAAAAQLPHSSFKASAALNARPLLGSAWGAACACTST